MKGDKFEQKLMVRLSKGNRIDTTSCVLTEILSDYRAFKAEQTTAPASLVEFPCPTCGAEMFKTERRLNGDSWCRYGHKHPTKDFVRPVPSDKPASPSQEPLAVLADRKGWEIAQLKHLSPFPNVWEICLRPKGGQRGEWVGENWPDFDTYAAAEAKARAFLSSQPDVNKENV